MFPLFFSVYFSWSELSSEYCIKRCNLNLRNFWVIVIYLLIDRPSSLLLTLQVEIWSEKNNYVNYCNCFDLKKKLSFSAIFIIWEENHPLNANVFLSCLPIDNVWMIFSVIILLSPNYSEFAVKCDWNILVILINATTLMHKSILNTNNFGNNHFEQKYQKQNNLGIFRRL